jgi:hypothetical protein
MDFSLILQTFTEANELKFALSGAAVSTGPKVRGFKSGQGNELLRAIKIFSTPYCDVAAY